MCAGQGGSRPQPPLPCAGPSQPCTIHGSGGWCRRLCSPLHEEGMGCPQPQLSVAATCGLGSDWECFSLGREGTTQDPKDKGTGMTHPGLAAAAAELCQHEELLAEQPGDPTEEIGPFKRDSDK